ncbi:ATP-binding protein [Egbenema bharatensis]|uniref:ATP-binding protein n=1 Tax=Egbenema bharatensis TaxID=3463334 RepID=UPI003A8BDA8A
MTVPSDLPLSTTEPTSASTSRFDSFLSFPGRDLAFIQDGVGHYLSFYWREAEAYGLRLEQLIGKPMNQVFVPVLFTQYLERVRQVVDSLIPVQFEYAFAFDDRHFVFDLTVSPILMPHGTATTAVVTGQLLYAASREQALDVSRLAMHPKTYLSGGHSTDPQKRLTQVVWDIRRSLDLETIWQKTVDGLGESLGLSRCFICPYQPDDTLLKVVAEYRQPPLKSLIGTKLGLEETPYLKQALETLRPIALDAIETDPDEPPLSVLVIVTTYKDQPNGLIVLHQLDRSRLWNDIEIDLLMEIADQVGTGVAYSMLLEETRTLASELQQANESLVQQHKELEEARLQAEDASRRKSEFLANTSHELRTPLNGMIGFLKLILDGMADDPEEQKQFIEEAHHSAIHLLNIINDILDIAKIEAGKMQLELNPIRLDDLVSAVENFTRPQAQQKNLAFEIRVPATRDEVVINGNYQRLLQVMLNLVSNAIKFTHEGEVVITAEILPKTAIDQDEEKPGMVKISVADTGIGVSLEKQDKLFQSFSQIDGSRTRQYGGTGLGLTISQKLVEAMGGVVNFFSMGEGLGSTVTFTVPLYQDPVMITAPESEIG